MPNPRRPHTRRWLALGLLFTLALGIRVFYASQQKDIYWDELHSLGFAFRQYYAWDIDKDLSVELSFKNNTPKAYVQDMVQLYIKGGDPQISGTYYALLRTALLFRVKYSIPEIILLGTLLNGLFLLLSLIFLEKLLRLFFPKNEVFIWGSLFCIAFIPSSVSFGMFLRPYQMQETFFIMLSYYSSLLFITEKFTCRNFFILGGLSAGAMLALNSSLLFIVFLPLCFSFSYFIRWRLRSITLDEALRRCIYTGGAFAFGLPLAQLGYLPFIPTLINSLKRAKGSLKAPDALWGYLDQFCFPGFLSLFFILAILTSGWALVKKRPLVENKASWALLQVLVVSWGFFLYANVTAPNIIARYSVAVFPLIFLSLSGLLSLFPHRVLQKGIWVLLILWYGFQIHNPARLEYFEDSYPYYSFPPHSLYLPVPDPTNPEDSFVYTIPSSWGYFDGNFLYSLSKYGSNVLIPNLHTLKNRIEEDKPPTFFLLDFKNTPGLEPFLKSLKGYTITAKFQKKIPIYRLEKDPLLQ